MTPRQDNDSTNEDRFGRQDHQRYSPWSSFFAVGVAVIAVGLIYFYLI